MFKSLLSKVIGDPNERELNRLRPLVEAINALEPEFEALSDEELRGKTMEFLSRLQAGESLDDVVAEAFAAVREASKRTTGLRHFDVQLMGGMVLHEGKVAEMRTGEGKTLVATLPLYLNALEGKGCHLVTVNDYLARRDVQWMGPIYDLLGLKIGLLQQEGESYLFDSTYEKGKHRFLRAVSRREAYAADITYGTNHEFGFDYLRDNLAMDLAKCVQRELYYAIVDEVDNIFIDEARTPLIISGPSDEPVEEYTRFGQIAKLLQREVDYEVDEKERAVMLTEAGLARVEKETGIVNIYDEANYKYVHYMEQALKAEVLFREGRDYIKQRGNIILVDEFTGRLMPDRRLSDGLHQAIEAKEGVRIRPRMMTYATITIQNYFRMYKKLAGMTGTAATEAEELHTIYGLDVVVIPTHKPMIRVDYPDVIYRTEASKWDAIVQEIEECYRQGRPMLVGTASIEKSEYLSRRLALCSIRPEVLHAKHHAREAAIIAKAGEPSTVTVATQMAGRGVDIKLGGDLPEETLKRAQARLRQRGLDPFRCTEAQLYSAIAEIDPDYVLHREKVLELEGLHIIGTERHDARRIDNQLRGRAGRQGEPGSSRFYLSLEDDLMRRFGGPAVSSLMERLGVEDDIPIEHNLVSKAIENAQTRVEGYHFDMRKHLLEYDDVLNRQRQLIYDQRRRVLTKDDLYDDLWTMIETEVEQHLQKALAEPGQQWMLFAGLDNILPLFFPPRDAPFVYPYTVCNAKCFPPFSVSFLAEQLAGSNAKDQPQDLMNITRQALADYRNHILDKVIREGQEKTLEHYAEGLTKATESLERKIEEYSLVMEERGLSARGRDLVQHLQRVFALPLGIKPSAIGDQTIEQTVDQLFEELEISYHQKVCENLVRAIQVRTLEVADLENVRISDLDPALIEEFLEQTASRTYNDEAFKQLRRLADNIRAGKGKEARYELPKLILDLNKMADLEIAQVGDILSNAIAMEYDRWAERQLREIQRNIQERATRIKETSPVHVTQLLLDTYYLEMQRFDKAHKRQTFVSTRIPMYFLVTACVKETRPEALRQMILTHLQKAAQEREAVFGRDELIRLGHQVAGDLPEEVYEGLVKYVGERETESLREARIGELPQALYDDIRCCLETRQLGLQKLTDLKVGPEILQYLSQRLEEKLRGQKIAQLDEPTRSQIEQFLRQRGHLDDQEAEQRLGRQKLGDLDRETYKAMAAVWGQELVANFGQRRFGDLDEQTRHTVRQFLIGQGYFVNEEAVQRIFVYQTVNDLGEAVAAEACLYLSRTHLDKLKLRKIGRLDFETQQAVLTYLQVRGLFTDHAGQQHLLEQTLLDLDQDVFTGLARYLGRQRLSDGHRIADLDKEARLHLMQALKEQGHFTDQARLEVFPHQRLPELGAELFKATQQELVQELVETLKQTDIGEVEANIQKEIQACLDRTDYFVDEEKARRLRQQPLSQLKSELIYGLERHFGQKWMDTFDSKALGTLEPDVQDGIVQYLEQRQFGGKHKVRRKALQHQTLRDLKLSQEMVAGLSHHIGRKMLTNIRHRRLGELSENMQQEVWTYLKEQGYLTDKFKLELLPYQKLTEFGPQTEKAITDHLVRQLQKELEELPVAQLGEDVRVRIWRRLEENDYFVDQQQLRRFEQDTVMALSPELYDMVTLNLGQHLLHRVNNTQIRALPAEVQNRLWNYLEEVNYFVDASKKQSYTEKRLADLDAALYEGLVQYLGRQMETEVGQKQVADLDEGTRQELRQYLDSIDYFVNQDELASTDNWTMADLKKEDYGGLALFLGLRELDERKMQGFGDLRPEMQSRLLHHLRQAGYFLDREKVQALNQQTVDELEESIRAALLEHLRQQQEQVLQDRCLTDLDRETRLAVERFVRERGVAMPVAEMQRWDDQQLANLPVEEYDGIMYYLGHRRLEEVANTRLSELDGKLDGVVKAYLGRRVMAELEREVMLYFINYLWIDYLTAVEDLRQGIGLEAFGQRDPLVQYKIRAFKMFEELQANICRSVVTNVFRWPPQPLKLSL